MPLESGRPSFRVPHSIDPDRSALPCRPPYGRRRIAPCQRKNPFRPSGRQVRCFRPPKNSERQPMWREHPAHRQADRKAACLPLESRSGSSGATSESIACAPRGFQRALGLAACHGHRLHGSRSKASRIFAWRPPWTSQLEDFARPAATGSIRAPRPVSLREACCIASRQMCWVFPKYR